MDLDRNCELDAAFAGNWLSDRDVDHIDRKVLKTFTSFLCKSEDATSFPSPVSTVSELDRGQKHLAWDSLEDLLRERDHFNALELPVLLGPATNILGGALTLELLSYIIHVDAHLL
jgi:hypothetical protein